MQFLSLLVCALVVNVRGLSQNHGYNILAPSVPLEIGLSRHSHRVQPQNDVSSRFLNPVLLRTNPQQQFSHQQYSQPTTNFGILPSQNRISLRPLTKGGSSRRTSRIGQIFQNNHRSRNSVLGNHQIISNQQQHISSLATRNLQPVVHSSSQQLHHIPGRVNNLLVSKIPGRVNNLHVSNIPGRISHHSQRSSRLGHHNQNLLPSRTAQRVVVAGRQPIPSRIHRLNSFGPVAQRHSLTRDGLRFVPSANFKTRSSSRRDLLNINNLDSLARVVAEERNDNPVDGSYSFRFETSDGVSRHEEGISQGPNGAVIKRGGWSFTYPDGTPAVFNYVADENGFRIESPLIPQIPAHSLEQIRRAEEQGNLAHVRTFGNGYLGNGNLQEVLVSSNNNDPRRNAAARFPVRERAHFLPRPTTGRRRFNF